MTTNLSLLTGSALVLALGLAAGCQSAAQQGSALIDTSKVPDELMPDYQSFATNCSKCHSLSRALNAPVTSPKHWDIYVAKMMRTAGSAIHPSEAPKILRFLHWYTASYDDGAESGPKASPPPSNPPPAQKPYAPPAPAAAPVQEPGASAPASENLRDDMQTQAGESP